jgi:hypothetical protein
VKLNKAKSKKAKVFDVVEHVWLYMGVGSGKEEPPLRSINEVSEAVEHNWESVRNALDLLVGLGCLRVVGRRADKRYQFAKAGMVVPSTNRLLLDAEMDEVIEVADQLLDKLNPPGEFSHFPTLDERLLAVIAAKQIRHHLVEENLLRSDARRKE